MGKGKKPQNEEEVLGQIFDFIFKEAKKDPKKRKPIRLKPTGISTSHELVDGLAAALEQPGMLITDQMLDSMNKALTVEFGRLNANESGSKSAKFSTTTLADFLSDPNKFLSKPKEATKLGMRDVMKAAFLGRVQQGLVANAWAHKYNLDLDAKKAILGHYQAESIGAEAEAGRAFATSAGAIASGGDDDSRKNYVASRSADLLGREMFGRSGWDSMSQEKRVALQKAIIRGNGAVKKFMIDTYGDPSSTGAPPSARFGAIALGRYDSLQTLWKTDDMKERGAKVSGKDGIDVFDLKNYNLLETRNLEGRIEDMQAYLRRNPGLSINEQAKIQEGIERLGQAMVIVSGSHLDLSDVMRAKGEISHKISGFKSDLLAAQRAGDANKVRFYREQIKNLKSGDRQLNGMRFWGKVGGWEGKIDSWNGVMGGVTMTKGISSILDGSYYDDKQNSFHLPCEEAKVSFATHNWKVKDEEGKEYNQEYKENLKILTAKHRDLDKLKGTKKAWGFAMNQYDAFLTNIYYLTPQSIMKSLFVNGEGFVYLAHKRAMGAAERLGAGETINFEKLLKGDKAYLALLESKGIKGVNLATLKFTGGLASLFSLGQRKRDLEKAWLDEHVYKKLRQRVYNNLVKRFASKEAQALLEKWLIKGGFEVIAKAIVVGILDAIGIGATGGLGAFLVPILSSLVVDVLYGGAKFLIQVVLIMFLGVIGIIFFISIPSGKNNFDSQTYAYTNVVPGDVVTNPNFKGTSPIIQPEDPNNIGNFVGGTLPDGEKCLLGSGSFHCSQGPYGSYSHKKVAAVDITGVSYFYAPAFCGNGNCKVTSYGPTSCTNGPAGGMLTFTASYGGSTYEFKLIHVSSTFGSGSVLSAGQRVARIMTVQETTSACSSGQHLHLQTKMNGKVVNPRDVLNNSSSNGGFGCSVSVCDP